MDQFHISDSKKPSTTAAAKPPPATATGKDADKSAKAEARKLPPNLEDLDISEDFAKELAEGMAALMREIAAGSGDKPEENLTGAGGTKDKSSQEELEREAQFRKAWEDMLVEGMNGALDTEDFAGMGGVGGKGKGPAVPGVEKKAEVPDDSFQASIRKAMEKLKESDATLQVCCYNLCVAC